MIVQGLVANTLIVQLSVTSDSEFKLIEKPCVSVQIYIGPVECFPTQNIALVSCSGYLNIWFLANAQS